MFCQLRTVRNRVSCFSFSNFLVKCQKSNWNRISEKVVSRMEQNSEAYLRIKEGSDEFNCTFLFHVTNLNISKPMNFTRSLSEPIGLFLNRMSLKLTDIKANKTKKKNKKNVGNEVELEPVSINVIKDGVPVTEEVICKNIFEGDAKIELVIENQKYTIIKNNPWIHRMTLPKHMMSGYAVYPVKFESDYTDEDESEFLWYRVNSKKDVFLSSGIMYYPSVDDIGCKLKLVCTPKRNGISGIPMEIISPTVVEAGPGFCPFETRHMFTDKCLSGDSFRVSSYNILAELYASSQTGKNELFCYCPPYALAMDYRKLLITKELLGYNADIICLQEVDSRMFDVDLKRTLTSAGFEGEFAKKGGQVSEGVACYYRKSRFKLLSSQKLILGEDSEELVYLSHIWDIIAKNEILCTKFKERTTAAQILVFEPLDKPKQKLIVANTHLYFHSKADHIRLLQAGICLGYIDNLLKKLKQEDRDSKISVIFCGDFNSTPDCGVYKLFTTNHVPNDYHEWISEEEGESVIGLSLYNPINFGSACGIPEFTNYTPNFAGCLDYIFYQTDDLKVEQVIPFYSLEDVSKNLAIPSIVFPSDHIALLADLRWK